LNRAGRGGIIAEGKRTNDIQRARIRKTRWFFDDRAGFLARLDREIALHVKRARVDGLRPAVRLNGTSDISWERVAPDMLARWIGRGVTFYDYTKSKARAMAAALARANVERYGKARAHGSADWPAGYDLTFSWSGSNAADVAEVLAGGGRVAVPFSPVPGPGAVAAVIDGRLAVSATMPAPGWSRYTWHPVTDGDASDLRFLDGAGVVALKAKGPARRDVSGFVVRA